MRKKLYRFQIKLARFRRIRLPRHIRRAKVASRHPFAVPFITIGSLILITSLALLLAHQTNSLPLDKDAKIVIISHDHIQEAVPTHEKTIAGLLKNFNIKLNQGDVVEPALTTVIDQDQFRVNIYRAVPVEIIDNGQVKFTFSAATTPRAIASQSGARIYPEDIITTNPSQNFLLAGAIGEQIIIDRATPVSLNLYGQQFDIRTHATTVRDLLTQKTIVLAVDDEVTPALDSVLTSGTQVQINRKGTKIEIVTETIDMPTQFINDNSLAYGTSAVRQTGSSGQQVTTYQDNLQNGIVISRDVIQKVITKPTVTQIVVIGTSLSGIKGDMALAGIPPSDYQYVDYIVSRESHWCPTVWQGESGCPAYHGTPTSPNVGYGLCQSTPGYKMADAGADWATNPITQLKWCSNYANSASKFNAYGGGWYGAYNYWLKHANW